MPPSGYASAFKADDDLPPPYSSAAAQQSPLGSSLPSTNGLVSAHLDGLRYQLRQGQLEHASNQDQRDGETLSILIPHVESLLAEIGSMQPSPSMVEAYMVPEVVLGQEWHLTEKDDMIRGELRRVISIGIPPKVRGDQKGSSSNSPGSDLWWSDEDMARRLAKYLQPDRPRPGATTRIVKPTVEQNTQKKKSKYSSFFNKGSDPRDEEPQAISPPVQQDNKTSLAPSIRHSSKNENQEVKMDVRAEEVTFRRENEMGLWESKAGWGILLKVTISRL